MARGDQQKKYTAKEEVHSPNVKTPSVFLTAVIEAKESVIHGYMMHQMPLLKWTTMRG